MSSLMASLLNSTGVLQVYGRVFNVIQNNIANANTPGYVEQEQTLIPLPFDPAASLTGGVLPGPMISARSRYLEQAVRSQQELLGDAQQRANDLSQVQRLFDTTGRSGVPGALSGFFNSFSQLGVNPNDSGSRQSVIDAAGDVAEAFHQNAVGLAQAATNTDSQTRDTVAGINDLASQIAAFNARLRASFESAADAGLDARLNAALEELSGKVDYSVIKTSDGSYTLYAGGQTPLVIGDHAYGLLADFSGPTTIIRDSLGKDVTGQLEGSGGALGAMLKEKNVTLPGYRSALDTLAQSFADTVNTTLSQGVDRNGNAPAQNLFTYTAAQGAAFTLSVTNITPDEIAAALSAAPGGNGNAIAVFQLAAQPAAGGLTFTQAYGKLGGLVGKDVSQAQQNRAAQQDLVDQARTERAAATGVSLDKEATRLMQFQQAYQAVGRLVSILNSLTETVINIIPG